MAEVEQPQDAVKLFNRWTFDDVQVREWLFKSLLRSIL
jgi:small subunit ribosomal protein S5e